MNPTFGGIRDSFSLSNQTDTCVMLQWPPARRSSMPGMRKSSSKIYDKRGGMREFLFLGVTQIFSALYFHTDVTITLFIVINTVK